MTGRTDPFGPTFISYRRSQLKSIDLLARVLGASGVPLWRDVSDLGAQPTEVEIAAVLADPATGSAIVWITPDVDESQIIKRLEFPEILKRARARDEFFAVGIAASGLSYEEAAEVVDARILATSFIGWNLQKISSIDTAADAFGVASVVVANRLSAIRRVVVPDAPVRLRLGTRRKPPTAGSVLSMDWTGSFASSLPAQSEWDNLLLPSLKLAAIALVEQLPETAIVVEGNAHLSAALAFGRNFVAPGPTSVDWAQSMPDSEIEEWSTSVKSGASGFEVERLERSTRGVDLAVLISVTADVETAFRAGFDDVGAFCAIVNLKPSSTRFPMHLDKRAAISLARLTIETIKESVDQYRCSGIVHLFIAGPAGLAFLIGQLSNSLGPIQTYEHVDDSLVGHYVPSVLLPPTR